MSDAEYNSPLATRYASREMVALWGDTSRTRWWRTLWRVLAETQAELGLAITSEQIEDMTANRDRIDFESIARYEEKFRHDVMAHIHAFGDVATSARPILHLGATSCYVTDNADLILLREGLLLLQRGMIQVMRNLAQLAREHRDLAVLGFTHFQPAQLTTLGKRLTLYLADLWMDWTEVAHRLEHLRLRGAKGTTGTQASFLALFDGDHAKVRRLDQRVAEKLGFRGTYPVTGQTYSRKVDAQILETLSGIAQSAAKFATDLRLLAHRKEVEEPFEAGQIGSSAMPYKRNPMRSERIGGLARFVCLLSPNAAMTASTQWLERTLDDSANRRLILPQAFLATDAILRLYANITDGLVVHPRMIARSLAEELPFMATENILMAAVRAGGDRQELHERIRQHSHAAAARVKGEGQPNDLIERLRQDPLFTKVEWERVLDPQAYIGRAPQQVDEFLAETITPLLTATEDLAPIDRELRV